MSGRVVKVEAGSFSVDCLRFGRGADALAIFPGASVLSVMVAADAIEEAYSPLAEDFTVYLLDYRRSFPSPYSVPDMERDAYEALRALKLDRACVFGASLGGMVAQVLAIEHPALVRKLVLGSTAAQVPAGRRQLFERWAALADAGDAKALCLSFGEAVYPPNVFEQLRGQLNDAARAASAEDLARFAGMMRAVMAFDVADELDKIACPVLAIGSSDDRVLGAEGTLQIAGRLGGRPGFETFMYDGYGHAAYDTAPDYRERMLQFLTS